MTERFKYYSTKTWLEAFPVAYRQWKADSHCSLVHGYALTIHLEFGTNQLDARNWCTDFGSLRQLRGTLEDWFDHTLIVAEDDPHKELLMALGAAKIAKITVVEKTGCEGLSEFILNYINDQYLPLYEPGGRVVCTRVEVRETQANMAMTVRS